MDNNSKQPESPGIKYTHYKPNAKVIIKTKQELIKIHLSEKTGNNYFITNSIYNKYFISLLNTNVIDWYYKRISAQLGKKAVRLFSIYVQNLPIPKIPKSEQKFFETLVNKLIAKKEAGKDTAAEEQKIDIMVYKLYDLTYDEVKIVEPEFALTKEEYEHYG